MNGTTVPTMRDNTYSSSEVSRKTSEELKETAFNEDQNEVLDDIIDNIPSGLPAVTVEDEGDVLTVVGGVWDKAAAGGGGEALIAETTDFDAMDIPDKILMTGTESWEAFSSGRPIFIHYINGPFGGYTREEMCCVNQILKADDNDTVTYSFVIDINNQTRGYSAEGDGYYLSPYA